MFTFAEQFHHDKRTLLTLYLVAVRNLEEIQEDFEKDDLVNGIGSYRRQFGSNLLTPAVQKVGSVVTPIIDHIETSINAVFANIQEQLKVIKSCHANLYNSYEQLATGDTQAPFDGGLDHLDNSFVPEDRIDVPEDRIDVPEDRIDEALQGLYEVNTVPTHHTQVSGPPCAKKLKSGGSNADKNRSKHPEAPNATKGYEGLNATKRPEGSNATKRLEGSNATKRPSNLMPLINQSKKSKVSKGSRKDSNDCDSDGSEYFPSAKLRRKTSSNNKKGSDGSSKRIEKEVLDDPRLHVSKLIKGRNPPEGDSLAKCVKVIAEDLRLYHASQKYTSASLIAFRNLFYKHLKEPSLAKIQATVSRNGVPPSFLKAHFGNIFTIT